MAKKNRPPETSTVGLPNPASLTNTCIPVMEEQFGYSPLRFAVGEQRVRGITRYELVGSFQQRAIARDRYLIHPLPGTALERHWAAVALDFQYIDPVHNLTSAQIIVFKGDPFGDKLPLFRAEWHCSPSDLSAPHAQPHWHVYSVFEETAKATFGETRTLDFPGDLHRVVLRTLDFHFAMSSSWHTNGADAHRHAIANSAALTNWLQGCLQYIRGEFG